MSSTSAKTPSVAIARALRAIGLKQGRGKDFAVTGMYEKGERQYTYIVEYTADATRAIVAHADQIEALAAQEGFSFVVSIWYHGGHKPSVSVHNGPARRVREEPPALDDALKYTTGDRVWITYPDSITADRGAQVVSDDGGTLVQVRWQARRKIRSHRPAHRTNMTGTGKWHVQRIARARLQPRR